MKKITALLAGAAALVAGWGLGYATGHKEHGAMVALDEVEWIPRPTSPVEVAVLSGDPATGAHVRLVKCRPVSWFRTMRTRAIITA